MKTRAHALTVALGLTIASCTVDDQVSLQMAAICAPPEEATDCFFEGECGARSLGIAGVDVGATDRLWLFVQVNNQTANNADDDTFRGNSHDAYVEEVAVEFEAPFPIPSTTERVGPYTVPAEGNAVVSVFPVNPVSAAAIDAVFVTTAAPVRIIAKTRLKGRLQDNTEFETAAMEIAVDACKNCFDPTPCGTAAVAAVCPPNLGQAPVSVACEE